MKRTVFILLLSFLISCCHYREEGVIAKHYFIGETKISVIERCYYPCHPGVLFINLHHNETTSLNAGKQYLNRIGGRLINIDNNGERLINFKYNEANYTFDPNRIYSAYGIDSTVTALSQQYDSVAALQVSKFARSLISDFIYSSNLIVSLHNNRDSSLSILTFKDSSSISNNSAEVFINPAMDVDDFLLTTDKGLFKRIKEKNINVVCEDIDIVKDDGSLSLYAARNKIPYVNIEAQHQHFDEQLEMLMVLEDIIKEYRQE